MVVHSATLELNEQVAALRAQGRSIVHLGFGEAGLPILDALLATMRDAAADASYASVAGSPVARQAAAGYWSRRGLPTTADQIIFGPGSKSLLFAALAAVEGDVVLPVPSWVTYAAQATLTGKRVLEVPTSPGQGGVPDPERLEAELDGAEARGIDPRILVVTLPDNPTGTLPSEDVVAAVCEIAERRELVIVSDEIYRDLVHDGRTLTSPASRLPERTIVTCGLSKSLALGGWRIGFARVPATLRAQGWMDTMRGVGSEVWSAMGTPMERVAALALDEPDEVVTHIARSRRLHQAVATAVRTVFMGAGAVVPELGGGFYLYPDLEARRDELATVEVHTGAELARFLLDQHGVAVLRGEAFGDDVAAFRFRVATSLLYGSGDQRRASLEADDPLALPWIAEALERITATFADLSRRPKATT